MKPRVLLALSAAVLVAAACGEPSGPRAGDLIVSASAPTAARALVVRVTGQVTSAAAPAGSSYRVFSSTLADTTKIVVIAPTGTTLGAGALVRLSVSNTGNAAKYIAQVIQASGGANQLISVSIPLAVTKP